MHLFYHISMRFLRWIFPQKERHNIDGREVILLNRTELNFPSFLRDIILHVCKAEQIAMHFSKLTFVLESSNDMGPAEVRIPEFFSGKSIIHLNLRDMDLSAHYSRFYGYWGGVIIHELTHLLHELESNISTQHFATFQRLKTSLGRKKNQVSQDHAELRTDLFTFVRLLFEEGVACYYEKIRSEEILFSEDFFNRSYLSSQTKMTSLVELLHAREKALLATKWREYSHGKKREKEITDLINQLQKLLFSEHFRVGEHMVYTIFFVDKEMSLQKMMNLRPFEFIKEYEQCIENKDLQPVISATSGKGIFDYKRVLQEWAALGKELLKK